MERIRQLLSDLLARSESEECFLCDSGGYLVAQEGATRGDAPLLSALAAGVFLASRELARMLGENEFNTVYHQGENKHIFICAVTAELLLVIIFSSSGNLGLVKLYSAPAVAGLQELFTAIQGRHDEVASADHRSFVLKEDAIFLAKPAAAR